MGEIFRKRQREKGKEREIGRTIKRDIYEGGREGRGRKREK
jgi:hypothetical protein